MSHRINNFRQLLAASALSTGLMMSPAHAADAAPAPTVAPQTQDASGALTEIVVTAQKREENQQKTPISISVFKAGDLNNRHIQSLLDLQDGSIPSLRVLPFSGRNFSLILNIRGVGVLGDTNQPARDAGVGVYIDGVYIGRPQGLNGALYDLEGVEVLKGPQGTLFGRNTEGGALNITTKKPTGKFDLSATAGVGNYGSYEGELHLDLPEFHDVSVKLDGLVTARDGTVKNPLVGAADFNGYSRRGVRGQVQWRPLANFTALYSFDLVYDASTVGYTQRVTRGTSFVPDRALQPDRADTAAYGVPLQPSIGHQHGHTVTLKWEPNPHLTLKSISSYRELTQNQFDNGGWGGSNFVVVTKPTGVAQTDNGDARYSLANFAQYQYSQELQAVGDFGRVKYAVGALAYHEHVRDQAQAFYSGYIDGSDNFIPNLPTADNTLNLRGRPVTNVVTPLYPNVGVDRASVAQTTSIGIYGQATWTPAVLDDHLHLTGGLRWNSDNKKGTLLLTNNFAPLNKNGTFAPLSFDSTWRRVDPMLNAAFDVTDTVQIYGKWSTGYKSGGANSRSLNYGGFNPESVSMFEAGLKSEFLNRHVRFNIAGYTGLYKNQQVDFTVPYFCFDAGGKTVACPGDAGTVGRTTTNTFNTPDNGRVSGIEAELKVAVMRGLTLGAAYTYAYARVGSAVNPYPQEQRDGTSKVDLTPSPQQAINTPTHSASGQIDYETAIGDYTVRAHLDGAWDSGSFNSSTPNAAGIWNPRSEPGLVINGRLALADIALPGSDAKLTTSLWVRNLFNEQHLVSRTYSPSTGVYGYFNDPRTYGVQVNVKF